MSDLRLDDRILRGIYEKLGGMIAGDSGVKVGVLSTAKAHVDPFSGETISMPELAAIHEYGAPRAGIPERSFVRRTFAAKQAEMRELTAELSKALILKRSMTVERALGLLGAWGATEIRNTLMEGEGVPPALKAKTIADRKRKYGKASTRPLVSTAQLSNSITWAIG